MHKYNTIRTTTSMSPEYLTLNHLTILPSRSIYFFYPSTTHACNHNNERTFQVPGASQTQPLQNYVAWHNLVLVNLLAVNAYEIAIRDKNRHIGAGETGRNIR